MIFSHRQYGEERVEMNKILKQYEKGEKATKCLTILHAGTNTVKKVRIGMVATRSLFYISVSAMNCAPFVVVYCHR